MAAHYEDLLQAQAVLHTSENGQCASSVFVTIHIHETIAAKRNSHWLFVAQHKCCEISMEVVHRASHLLSSHLASTTPTQVALCAWFALPLQVRCILLAGFRRWCVQARMCSLHCNSCDTAAQRRHVLRARIRAISHASLAWSRVPAR